MILTAKVYDITINIKHCAFLKKAVGSDYIYIYQL